MVSGFRPSLRRTRSCGQPAPCLTTLPQPLMLLPTQGDLVTSFRPLPPHLLVSSLPLLPPCLPQQAGLSPGSWSQPDRAGPSARDSPLVRGWGRRSEDQVEQPRPPALRVCMLMPPIMPPAVPLRPRPAAHPLPPIWCRASPLARDLGWRQVDTMEEPHPLAFQACESWPSLPLAAQLCCPRAPALLLLCPPAPAPPPLPARPLLTLPRRPTVPPHALCAKTLWSGPPASPPPRASTNSATSASSPLLPPPGSASIELPPLGSSHALSAAATSPPPSPRPWPSSIRRREPRGT